MNRLAEHGQNVLNWGVLTGHISKQEAQNYGIKLFKEKNPLFGE